MRHTLVILALTACGSPNTTPDAAHGVDAPNVHLDAAIDAPAARQGFVTISEGTGSNGMSSSASAQFTDSSPFGTAIGTNGPCTAYSATGNPMKYSAGSIDITGTSTPITLVPSGTAPMVRYAPATTPLPTNLFAAGASIVFHAAGAPDFASFSATVTAPALVAGFTPPTMLSRAGYTATWTAGSGPGMWIIVVGIGTSSGTTLLCKVGDTGSYTIAAASFALIPSDATQGVILLARVAETDVSTVIVAIATTVTSALIPLNP